MGEISLAFRKLLRPRLLVVIGASLVIAGVIVFLNSLGSGGGYFPAALIASGTFLIVVAIVKRMIRAFR